MFTRKSYLELWRGERYISRHVTTVDAADSAQADAMEHGGGVYQLKVGDALYYEVDMSFMLGSGGDIEEVAPPVLVGRKFNPGPYIKSRGGHTNTDQDAYHADMLNQVTNNINNIPEYQGALVAFACGYINPAPGVYEFTAVDNMLNFLKSQGKRLMFEMPWKSFNNASIEWIAPADLLPDQALQTNSPGWIWMVWRQANMDRLIEIWAAIADRYDSDPNFELVTGAESGPSLGGVPQADFTHNSLRDQLIRLDEANAVAFQNTTWCPYINSLAGRQDALLESAYQNRIGFGEPDYSRSAASSLWRGDTVSSEVDREFRGTIVHHAIYSGSQAAIQAPEDSLIFNETGGIDGGGQQATHISFVIGLNPPGDLANVEAAIQANPDAFATACPSRFSSCVTG